METMHQEHSMFTLVNDDASVIKLGQLRQFLNETCRSLPDSTPITINSVTEDDVIVPCIQVLADKESVELYNF